MSATASNAHEQLLQLSAQLNEALSRLHTRVIEYANAERDYRKARARAWVETPKTKDTVAAQREAAVDAATADERRDRDIADGLRQAELEAVRSRRAQISALQTLMNGYRAEAEFVRTTGGVPA